jgi:predicted ATP-dependent endonuclease of OLD family
MKLISASFHGYRRFSEPEKLRIDGKLTALVGANESGKTSILRALLSLNDDRAVAPGEVSRRASFESDHIILCATYFLEEEDIKALEGIPEAANSTYLYVRKKINGRRTFEITPSILRNPQLRAELLDLLKKVLTWPIHESAAEHLIMKPLVDMAENALNFILDTEAQKLSKQALAAIRNLASELSKSSLEVEELGRRIGELLAYEESEHPSTLATTKLADRIPRFVNFEAEDRLLDVSYDVRSFYREKNPERPPSSLMNLVSVAGITLDQLHKADGIRAKKETIEAIANKNLQERIAARWKQAPLDVHVRIEDLSFSILVASKGGKFEDLSERSEGLRQFVALAAFLLRKAESSKNFVLLIDEAETHLHYNAQADLVEMLTKQELAQQVIYTTHSIGCFPESIGMDVRVVQPVLGDTSKIENKLWLKDGVGLSPILKGMGADTMAFFPFRQSVLTEGPGDMILLPALMRCSIERTDLGFYVFPGLAQITSRNIPIIGNSGRHVAYLLDGDAAGDARRKQLIKAGVPRHLILQLTNGAGDACVIEDLLDKPVYIEAINRYLKRNNIPERIADADLTETLRPTALKEWCKARKIDEPGKVDIAYLVIAKQRNRQIANEETRAALQGLHKKIRGALQG